MHRFNSSLDTKEKFCEIRFKENIWNKISRKDEKNMYETKERVRDLRCGLKSQEERREGE